MSLSPDQVTALTQLAESLKGTTIEDFIKSSAGQPTPNEKTPDPTTGNSPPSKGIEDPKTTLDHVNQTHETSPPSASIYLAIHAKNYIQRELNVTKSSYIPSSQKMFFILNIMDTLLSQNFYARRALPGFFPTVTRLYFAILFHIQTLRCMDHVQAISYGYSLFLERFMNTFPIETLPIPGPLLPVFKALCCSVPENKRLRRVYPTLPIDYLTSQDANSRLADNLPIDKIIPFIPQLAHLHSLLPLPFGGRVITGADGSHAAVSATLTVTAEPGYDTIIDLLHHPRPSIRQLYFPFPSDRIAPHALNGTNETHAVEVTIYGNTATWQNQAADLKRSLTNAGIAEEIRVNKDLITQFKSNFTTVPIPIPDLTTDDTNDPHQIDAHYLMDQSLEWFADLIAQMTAYATFWPGSGTLGDCSVDGPRTSQYVCQLIAPAIPPATPRFFADPASLVRFDHRLETSVSEEETITELLSRYAAVNITMYPTHPWAATIGNNTTRLGDFWTVLPRYTNGTIDQSWIQTNQALKATILEKPSAIHK